MLLKFKSVSHLEMEMLSNIFYEKNNLCFGRAQKRSLVKLQECFVTFTVTLNVTHKVFLKFHLGTFLTTSDGLVLFRGAISSRKEL